MEKSLRLLASVIDTRMGMPDRKPTIPTYSFRGQNNRPPSVAADGIGNALLKEPQKYSGTKMLGLATLHKSNAVPVFSEEEIVDISHMRR